MVRVSVKFSCCCAYAASFTTEAGKFLDFHFSVVHSRQAWQLAYTISICSLVSLFKYQWCIVTFVTLTVLGNERNSFKLMYNFVGCIKAENFAKSFSR